MQQTCWNMPSFFSIRDRGRLSRPLLTHRMDFTRKRVLQIETVGHTEDNLVVVVIEADTVLSGVGVLDVHVRTGIGDRVG